MIPLWHIGMLNDTERNRKYCQAIFEAKAAGCQTILDIGAGCGLLSAYAIQVRILLLEFDEWPKLSDLFLELCKNLQKIRFLVLLSTNHQTALCIIPTHII